VSDQKSISGTALSIAVQQIGVSEQPKGSNSGPMVDRYLAAVGLKPGYPWCMAFVYWSYQQAALAESRPNPVVQTGSVAECWSRTPDAKKIHVETARKQPQSITPGDQFVLLFGHGTGHTGLVEAVTGNIIHTIEGNSNLDGSREGFEVVRHQRLITDRSLAGFIKYQ